jgi:hypothetical protein
MFRKMKRAIRKWWECQTKQCDYYENYLAYGPAELTHIGFHAAERLAGKHFDNCSYNGPGSCSICQRWEQRLRA